MSDASTRRALRDLSPLFEPAGVIVAGVSSHPGKFGFATLHHLLTCGYQGRVFATNRSGGEILGVECLTSIRDVPAGAADLVYVCVPAPAVLDVLRDAAAVGVRAAFVASAGFGEGGDRAGADLAAQLAAAADELDLLVAGPNGQGLVSTPAALCAQFVGPWPTNGPVSVVSQSGNLASGAMNHATASGVGIARAVSAGNSLCLDIADYLEWFGADAATKSVVAYVEGVADARRLHDVIKTMSPHTPVVVVKGGASQAGAAAAASHTGSMATDDRVFDGLLRQAGAIRAGDIGEACAVAGALAVHPPMTGPNVAVLTNAGGWGVLTADALDTSPVRLAGLAPDLFAELDELLPARWSKSNPVDVAGGETRDTLPEAIQLLAAHESIDAVLLLGLGIQSNTAAMFRGGRFAHDESISRICAFHERQDARYAQAVVDVSATTGTPVLAATELAISDPSNPGPATLRANGHPCFPSPASAVAALTALHRVGQMRARRNS